MLFHICLLSLCWGIFSQSSPWFVRGKCVFPQCPKISLKSHIWSKSEKKKPYGVRFDPRCSLCPRCSQFKEKKGKIGKIERAHLTDCPTCPSSWPGGPCLTCLPGLISHLCNDWHVHRFPAQTRGPIFKVIAYSWCLDNPHPLRLWRDAVT